MKNLLTITKDVGLLTVALTCALVANFAYAQWANPTQAPVGGNVTLPVVTGSFSSQATTQTRYGMLIFGSQNDASEGGEIQFQTPSPNASTISVDAVNDGENSENESLRVHWGGQVKFSVSDASTDIRSDAPTLQFKDTTAGHNNWWMHANQSRLYFMLDRNGDGSWGKEDDTPYDTPWPLVLDENFVEIGPTLRTTEICNTNGSSCIDITRLTTTIEDNTLPACANGQILVAQSGSWTCGDLPSGPAPEPTYSSCTEQAVSWTQNSASCSGTLEARVHGASYTAQSNFGGPADVGSRTYSCDDGEWIPNGGGRCYAPDYGGPGDGGN